MNQSGEIAHENPASASGICKLCGLQKKLIRAHITPRSFSLHVKGASKNLLEARSHDGQTIQYWQNGIWDDEILCGGCDNNFSAWDDYGFKILGNPPGGDSVPQNDADVQPFILKDIDYGRLKLFVLSFLWRASISGQPFFSRIALGPYEPEIAEMLRTQNPGNPDKFPVTIFKLLGQRPPSAILAPRRQRDPDGINFALLYLPCIRITIKVDSRPLPKMLETVILRPALQNIVVPMTLHSGEVESFRTAAEIFRKRFPKP